MFAIRAPLPLSVLTLSVLACSDATGPAPGTGRVELLVATSAGSGGSSAAAATESMTLGGNTLVLERVQIVLREIELKRARGTADCSGPSGSNGGDDCEEFSVGPLLLDLPLGGGVARVVTIDADTGTFRELEFEVHKPDDDDGPDREFLQRHPDFARISIRADGTYNGTPFVFITDLNVEQEVDLVPPLVIAERATTSLTLMVDLREWFLSGARTTFVNPQSANKGGANEGLVKDNIKESFEAFEDDDRDGRRG